MVATSENLLAGSPQSSPTGTQPISDYLYQAMTLDSVTGLYDERFRNYSPSLGRWINQDPVGYINGANTYQFVGSDPVIAVDATGESIGRDIGTAIGNGIGATLGAITGFFGGGGGGAVGGVGTGPGEIVTIPAGAVIGTAVGAGVGWHLGGSLGGSAGAEVGNLLSGLGNWIEGEAGGGQCPGDGEQPPRGDGPEGAAEASPAINPADVAGKTPAEIDALAKQNGLIPKGPDPMNGRGSYIDPVTGQQRILIHPGDEPPAVHVNDPSGGRLDINGNPVSPRSPGAHLPMGGQP